VDRGMTVDRAETVATADRIVSAKAASARVGTKAPRPSSRRRS
jgi:hypothetical protein